ncbi:MAG: nucleotidyl transferase AbiEii/AbiGii toxin family protein [Candidatus Aenigmarchaeota archaeon]|nr:nucleotidyl transferase AbiEii/AbiGii toxin family protein [Candidatus Aenigmarchaeota archaeon]
MDRDRFKEFIAFLKGRVELKSEELLEKDFCISALLRRLTSKEYAFKGGTCLSKVYLNYHRISEDIDFTFIDQRSFENKTMKQVRRTCSEKITAFGRILDAVSKEYGFDFIPEKSNKRYVEIGGGSKIVTFKIWYRSVFTGAESFIKVQISFLEVMKFPVAEKTVFPLIDADVFASADRTYFHDFLDIYRPLKCPIYDLREIASEKIRALLTRRGIKTRDIVDLYFIVKMHKIYLGTLKEACIEKVNFAIRNYEKCRKNISARPELPEKNLFLEEVSHLMLAEIDRKDFDAFTEKLFGFLKEIKAAVLPKQ